MSAIRRFSSLWSTETLGIGLVGCVQFFVALEGSLLFPLGPVLAHDLHFPVSHLGYLNAAFLLSACVAGLVGAVLFDSVSRRAAIGTALCGLALSTALIALVDDLDQIVAARLLAGLFGGPAMALSLAYVSDIVPFERRGRALAAVSRGSAVALVMGVPLSLFLSEMLGWRVAMLALGAFGALLMTAMWLLLPATRGPARDERGLPGLFADFGRLAARRTTGIAILIQSLNGAIMLALAANLAPFFVANLGYPQHDLKYLWASGGLFVLVGSQLSGMIADRRGMAQAMWFNVIGAAIVYFLMFIMPEWRVPLIVTFCAFNAVTSGRHVATNLMLSTVPAPEERARFFSLVGSIGQAASALGVMTVSAILVIGPGGRLIYMDRVAMIAIAGSLIVAMLGTILVRMRQPKPLPNPVILCPAIEKV